MKVIPARHRNRNPSSGPFDPLASRAAFARKMSRAGLDPGKPIVADGRCHDFKTATCKGWYVYHEKLDEAWGAFGNWRTGEQFKWSSRTKTVSLTAGEAQTIRNQPTAEDAEEERQREEKRRQAKRLLYFTRDEDDDHPYLVRKQIWAHGVCTFHGHLVIYEVDVFGALAVPVLDDSERPQGIQFVCVDGTKRNLGPTKGGHYWIGEPERGRTLCVAEGLATGASVYEETGFKCCVSFGHSGFLHVAKYVRQQFNPRKLIVVADGDDVSIKSANAAARASNGLVFIADDGADYNDMVNRRRA